MSSRSRRVALYAIGAIAIAASINALTHSYAGLYDWATHHSSPAGRPSPGQPRSPSSWPSVNSPVYVAYLDCWPARQQIWPWATALTGLGVSVAGNVGHIQPVPATQSSSPTGSLPPLALSPHLRVGPSGLLVLKMTRQQTQARTSETAHQPSDSADARELRPAATHPIATTGEPTDAPHETGAVPPPRSITARPAPRTGLPHDATAICQPAATKGERVSRRSLARQLRDHGHRFSNEQLHGIAATVGLAASKAA